ncbi:hypothetical protein BLA29_008331 [Euroglyphus maynei]|uniref:PLOD1-3-like GT domain-containing protein n=1 Tax=Euroglyphus maynei TaxID=6958 RepID=A0A1Y3BM60_EURMA|nr:hypothetical protein BLA29_008331 [Euroglyphus maynei]
MRMLYFRRKNSTLYPKADGKRYLNSGGFIGFAPDIYAITNLANDINDDDDDQLFYTKIYLEQKYREKIGIQLDRNSLLFQNLNGEINDVEIRFSSNPNDDLDAFLYNKLTRTYPIIVHGNGASKIPLNSLGNYLAKSWHPSIGCQSCNDDKRINLSVSIDHNDYPHVLMAIIIVKPTPFFPEFLDYLTSLEYYKNRITIFIQSTTDYHNEQIEIFRKQFRNYYRDIRYSYENNEQTKEWQLRNNYL